jgi:hypothetical protein
MTARDALPPGIPAIVPKLIARLSSPFDHEVISTARSIGRILESNKLDWNDLAAAVAGPPGAPSLRPPSRAESDDAQHMRSWLTVIARQDWINTWTAGFVDNILRRPNLDRLSKKQMAVVNNIIGEAYRRGVRPERCAA